MTVRVRRLQHGEAALLRSVRLRALRDAPLAFWCAGTRSRAGAATLGAECRAGRTMRG